MNPAESLRRMASRSAELLSTTTPAGWLCALLQRLHSRPSGYRRRRYADQLLPAQAAETCETRALLSATAVLPTTLTAAGHSPADSAIPPELAACEQAAASDQPAESEQGRAADSRRDHQQERPAVAQPVPDPAQLSYRDRHSPAPASPELHLGTQLPPEENTPEPPDADQLPADNAESFDGAWTSPNSEFPAVPEPPGAGGMAGTESWKGQFPDDSFRDPSDQHGTDAPSELIPPDVLDGLLAGITDDLTGWITDQPGRSSELTDSPARNPAGTLQQPEVDNSPHAPAAGLSGQPLSSPPPADGLADYGTAAATWTPPGALPEDAEGAAPAAAVVLDRAARNIADTGQQFSASSTGAAAYSNRIAAETRLRGALTAAHRNASPLTATSWSLWLPLPTADQTPAHASALADGPAMSVTGSWLQSRLPELQPETAAAVSVSSRPAAARTQDNSLRNSHSEIRCEGVPQEEPLLGDCPGASPQTPACIRHLRYQVQPRAPPVSERIEPSCTNPHAQLGLLRRLRFSISPRGPSLTSAPGMKSDSNSLRSLS